MKVITCLVIILLSAGSSSQNRCAEKLFDGRPKEWSSYAGKEIATYRGYWTFEQCKVLCDAASGCEEFRIKKNSNIPYSGCVLMKNGTTYSGNYLTFYTMYKLAPCCAQKLFDGRPNEWEATSGKLIASYGGYWTLEQCRVLCEATSGCGAFRIKKGASGLYSGCVLMKTGTTYSGQYLSSFTMYKLIQC